MSEEKKSSGLSPQVIVAIIGVIGTILVTFMSTPAFERMTTPATPTSPPTATEMVSIVPTSEPTETALPPTATDIPPTATETPLPLPLEEVFPQVGAGHGFTFVNNPATFTGTIVRDDACVHSGIYGLQLVYDINNSGSAGWGVQWDDAPEGTVNLSEYSTLVFWVKGGTGSERFQIGIKDSLKREPKIESTDLIVLSREWQQVRVPLNRFVDANLGLINNINFGFNKNHSNGVLCIDDISLE